MKVIKLQDIKKFMIDNNLISLGLIEKFDELEVIETEVEDCECDQLSPLIAGFALCLFLLYIISLF